MTVSIWLSDPATNTWLINIRDLTEGQTFQKSFAYASSKLSAEWIVELPTVNNHLSTLSDFGQMTFAGCAATVSGKVGNISSFSHIQVTMDNRQYREIASTSSLTSNGSSFTVSYLD